MRPVIKAGWRDRRGAIMGWSLGVGAYIAINILVYGSIKAQADTLNKVLNNLPSGAKALFGGGSDFLSPVGYLNSKLYYLILPLLFIMLAISLANRLLAKEEEDGTLELLLARPISRNRLLLAKLLAGLSVILSVGFITLLITLVCARAVNYDVSIMHIAQTAGMTLVLSLLFGAVAWAMIGLGRLGRRAALGIAGGLAFASYLFSSLEGFASWLRWPAKLLPYHYYDPASVLRGTYNWWNAVGMMIATVLILSIAFIGFRRRDIG